jgi:hypothetical protein
VGIPRYLAKEPQETNNEHTTQQQTNRTQATHKKEYKTPFVCVLASSKQQYILPSYDA